MYVLEECSGLCARSRQDQRVEGLRVEATLEVEVEFTRGAPSDVCDARSWVHGEPTDEVGREPVHLRGRDVSRGCVRLGGDLGEAVDDADLASPGGDDALACPRVEASKEGGVTGCEVLRAVVEPSPIDASRGHPTAGPRALVEDGDLDALIREGLGGASAGEPGADDGDAQGWCVRAGDVVATRRDLEALGVAVGGVGPDLAEDGLRWRGGSICAAQTPQDAQDGGGVSSIERVPVVEVEQCGERLGGALGPSQELLAPGHAEVVVELSMTQQGGLREVPDRVLGLSARQGLEVVEGGSRVTLMVLKGLEGPGGQGVQGRVFWEVVTQMVGVFTPTEQLIEVLSRAVVIERGGLAREPKG